MNRFYLSYALLKRTVKPLSMLVGMEDWTGSDAFKMLFRVITCVTAGLRTFSSKVLPWFLFLHEFNDGFPELAEYQAALKLYSTQN